MARKVLVALLGLFAAVIVLSSCADAPQPQARSQGKPVSVDDRVKMIKQELVLVKQKLTDEGKYSCCIRGSCNWCLLNGGTCPCGNNWMEKKPLCMECDYHWTHGDSLTGGKSYADRDSMIRSYQRNR